MSLLLQVSGSNIITISVSAHQIHTNPRLTNKYSHECGNIYIYTRTRIVAHGLVYIRTRSWVSAYTRRDILIHPDLHIRTTTHAFCEAHLEVHEDSQTPNPTSCTFADRHICTCMKTVCIQTAVCTIKETHTIHTRTHTCVHIHPHLHSSTHTSHTSYITHTHTHTSISKHALAHLKKCLFFRNYWLVIHIYPTPPLGQDMTQGQFLSKV